MGRRVHKRHKVVLLLIGLLCLSVVIYAGEVITNDTGDDATGLRVSFSTPVLITAFGDILAAVDPQMLSFEFVFSGGTVKPWESHWLNYAPATASVMEYEWLTGSVASDIPQGSLSRDDLLNLGRAPTYEEIMSVIAEYPGEDEPLYVPSDDEAIWLTDLEGHADIYDNDSIKIHYADSFDQSQITKIEVYRNGVKMRFLPDMFNVLTNEQMKTFDGNPLENTPASSHTDHAIFGYEYEFRLAVSRVTAASELLTIKVRSPIHLQFNTPFAYIGSNWDLWMSTWDVLQDTEIRDLLARLKAAGFKGITVNVNGYVSDVYSSDVFALPAPDGRTTTWTKTASDEEIARILDLATEVGLETELRMQLLVSDQWTSVNGGYGGNIAPRDIDRFFETYIVLARHLAELAQQHGAVLFSPFTEMDSIERYTERIGRFYDGLDGSFAGAFAFEESTNHYLEGFNGYSYEDNIPFEQNVGKFWDWTNAAGEPIVVEWSCWSPTLETQADQRLSILVEMMLSFWQPALEYYRTHYPMNRLRFGEIGVYNVDGVCLGNDYVMNMDGFTAWDFGLSREWWSTMEARAGCCADFGTVSSGFSPPLAVMAALLGGKW
jgi:hypothetical protein